MPTKWGRKETIVWPPRAPIYTYGAVCLALLLTCFFGWQRFQFSQTFLERSYTSTYLKAKVGTLLPWHTKYWLFYLGGPGKTPRLALPFDFEPGLTLLPGGASIPVVFSPFATAQGYRFFYRGREASYDGTVLYEWLRSAIFDGDGLFDLYKVVFFEGGAVLMVLLCMAMPLDVERYKELKYGRRLKGPEMLSPKQFNKTFHGSGFKIDLHPKGTSLQLPAQPESKHTQIMGDTGAGKSQLLKQMLAQIEERGDSAIVYDPAGEFIQHFYRKDRKDYVLNPLDQRCSYWTPSSELRNPAEARTIAASLYQPNNDKKGEFFTETPQKVFAHLLKYRPTPQELVDWMSDVEEIDKRVEGTELASMIAKGAQQQRAGVLGSLGLVADSLRLLPTKEQADGREWSATGWAEKREGWIFLTSTEAEQEALRPLHSLWIDLLILRLLTPPMEGQKRVWFVIDELASLQRLPQFHTALTKGRKSDNPIIFGYQGKSQLEVIYGHLAEVMLSSPSTKFVLKTAEPKAAKWASELLGEVEIERLRETVADGKRAGKSFTLDRQIEPLVMASEIEGLPDLHAFMKQGNYVTRFSFPHLARQPIAPALLPRQLPESELWLNSLESSASRSEAAPPPLPRDPDGGSGETAPIRGTKEPIAPRKVRGFAAAVLTRRRQQAESSSEVSHNFQTVHSSPSEPAPEWNESSKKVAPDPARQPLPIPNTDDVIAETLHVKPSAIL